MAAQLAAQTELKSLEGNVLTLALPAAHKHLADKAYADKLKAALDQADRPQMDARVRGGFAGRRVAGGAEEPRAGRAEGAGPRRRFGASPSCRTCWPALMRK